MKLIKRIILPIIIIIIFLAALSIGLGLYFTTLSKSRRIFRTSVHSVNSLYKQYFSFPDDLMIGDTFQSESTLGFDLDSEYYSKSVNSEDIKKNHIIQNLNKLDTQIKVIQDKKNQALYQEVTQTIGKETILQKKFLVQNFTKYYFVDQVVKNYVNDGTCNYFETLTEEKTLVDNIDYLYAFIIDSLEKNLSEKDFKSYEVSHNIQNKDQSVHQVSIIVTDELIHRLLKDVLKDLKGDTRANAILSNTFEDFSKAKVSDKKEYLEKNHSIMINIYTTRLLYRPLKYEIISMKGDDKKSFLYELDGSKGTGYYLENDKMLYQFNTSFSDKEILVDIKNPSDDSLGEIRVNRDHYDTTINFSFDDKSQKYDFIYSSKYSSIKKNKSYHNDKKLSFKIVKNKISHLNGNIHFQTKVKNTGKVNEDVSSAILSSKLTEEEKELLKNKKKQVLERLEK